MINTLDHAKVIWDIILQHHGLFDSIFCNKDFVFILKFYSSLYNFLMLQQKLFTIFYLQTDSKIVVQKNTMLIYLRVFIIMNKIIGLGSS